MRSHAKWSHIGWIGLLLLSGLFLSKDDADALPDQTKQTPPVSSEAPSSPAAPIPTSGTQTPETPISETKRSLIRQLLEVTGGRQMYEQMQQITVAQMQQQMPPLIEQIVNSTSNLSPDERAALVARLSGDTNSLLTQFSEALRTEITYDELLERVYYPVYSQYFTEGDLSSLIAFYQTPIGEKLIAVSPQLFQTSLQVSNQVFMPRITEVLVRLMRQQIDQARKTPLTGS
jgi:uncharacterized protein